MNPTSPKTTGRVRLKDQTVSKINTDNFFLNTY